MWLGCCTPWGDWLTKVEYEVRTPHRTTGAPRVLAFRPTIALCSLAAHRSRVSHRAHIAPPPNDHRHSVSRLRRPSALPTTTAARRPRAAAATRSITQGHGSSSSTGNTEDEHDPEEAASRRRPAPIRSAGAASATHQPSTIVAMPLTAPSITWTSTPRHNPSCDTMRIGCTIAASYTSSTSYLFSSNR